MDQNSLDRLSDYWEAVRDFYYPFEEGLRSPTADVYHHEMPGGQFTNLKAQAASLGLMDRWHEVCDAYAAANQLVRAEHFEEPAVGQVPEAVPRSRETGNPLREQQRLRVEEETKQVADAAKQRQRRQAITCELRQAAVPPMTGAQVRESEQQRRSEFCRLSPARPYRCPGDSHPLPQRQHLR